MTVVIDGAILSLGRTDAATVWDKVLSRLDSKVSMRAVLLDRGGPSMNFGTIEVVPFPSYNPNFGPADSILLEQMCDHFEADVFVSTSFSTPLNTPSVMLVQGVGDAREQALAIAHARRFLCTSAATKSQLLRKHPELAACPVAVPEAESELESDLADALLREVEACAAEAAAGLHDEFGRRWGELRKIQAAVDVWDAM